MRVNYLASDIYIYMDDFQNNFEGLEGLGGGVRGGGRKKLESMIIFQANVVFSFPNCRLSIARLDAGK